MGKLIIEHMKELITLMKQNEERFSEEEIKKLEDLLLGSTDLDFL